MELLAGTSGFSYAPWKGPFYPVDLPDAQMLAYYAERFPTVEINNTFYRMPAPAMLEGWAAKVPPTFVFTLKSPRRITHDMRLAEVGEQVAEFARRAARLGPRLARLLFQLPPYLKKDVARLAAFLDCVPAGTPVTMEFRSSSWQDDEVHALLRSRDAVLCVTDTDEGETPFVATSATGYVRLRRTHYSDADLQGWVDRIASQGLPRTYVYFMHEDDALGTAFAKRMLELWSARGLAAATAAPQR